MLKDNKKNIIIVILILLIAAGLILVFGFGKNNPKQGDLPQTVPERNDTAPISSPNL